MGTMACIAMLAFAGSGNQVDVFNDLLPRPQQVEVRNDVFALPDAPLGFIVQAPDRQAAERLQARLREAQARLARLRESHGF